MPRLMHAPWRFASRLFRELKAMNLARRVTDRGTRGRIVISHASLPVIIERRAGASFVLNGVLRFEAWFNNCEPIFIRLGEGSSLQIHGDFTLGGGSRVIVSQGASLVVGGRKEESGSGITERCLIMARKRVVIGADSIIAWGCYITDCDWHELAGSSNTEETLIGEHVWVAPNCSILKGSRIGNGCIVATGSVTHKATFPESCLVGGIPARVLATDRKWSRDLGPSAVP